MKLNDDSLIMLIVLAFLMLIFGVVFARFQIDSQSPTIRYEDRD